MTITQPRTILALLLVPLLLAGGLLWGTWGAGDRLRSVEAAVVNEDRMVTLDGQAMPLGRQLAAELVDSSRAENLTWVLADGDGARAGLASGRFAAVVTIPPGFSAAATSFSGDASAARQATIDVQTSPVVGINETALGLTIADAAADALNRFLTGEYLKGIYLGFNDLEAQFVELRDGATTYAASVGEFGDGVGLLAGGMVSLADGVAVYTYGIDRAATGSTALADGLGELAGGAYELSAGVGELAAGVAAGAGEIPTYTDAERENLARAVASPIDTTALGGIVHPRVSWASLLLVLALWLGAMALWLTRRALDRAEALSTEANAALLWRTLRPGLGIGAGQALLLAALGAVVLDLTPGRTLGLALVLLLAAAAFMAVNHALACAGLPGRVIALVLLVLGIVPAVSSAAPALFHTLRSLSPLTPALDAVRAVTTAGSPTLPLLLVLTWLGLGVGASALAVARSRTVPVGALLAQPVG